MPDSLLFNGSTDERTFSAGSIAGNGAQSAAVIVKPTGSLSGTHHAINWNSNADAGLGVFFDLIWVNVAGDSIGPTVLADEWYLLGMSKPTGNVAPRYHMYRYSTTTWSHGAFNNAIDNFPACTSVKFMEQGGEDFAGNLLIAAVWDSELSDGTFETLEADQASWTTAAPDEAWRFDTTGTITPFVGTSTQTSSTGATLDTGDAPAGWSDAAAAVQVLQASADSADGNWTDQSGGSSLFAAIDEDVASDSDYIRSELSPQSSGCRVKLEAGGDPAVSTGHEINWRIAKDTTAGQTINMTVKLYQGGGNSLGGGTLIADFDRNAVSNTFTDYAEALSGGEADAITDYTDLYLEFWADVP